LYVPDCGPYLVLLGQKVREAREAEGMTLVALGKETGYSPEQVGKIELGDRTPSDKFMDEVVKLFPAIAVVVRELYAEVRKSGRAYEPWFRTWAQDVEPRAASLRWWEPSLIPGILQTDGYMRALFTAWRRPDIDADVTDRLNRQKIIDRADPPELWVVIDETVLDRCVGSPGVMAGQLQHVVTMSERPGVSVQILPADTGAHAGLLGAFIVARFGDDSPDMGYLETAEQGEMTRDSVTVAHMLSTFTGLCSDALPRTLSRDRIARMASKWTER
jgi:transcriptional regulator with XRE-family HTH domain